MMNKKIFRLLGFLFATLTLMLSVTACQTKSKESAPKTDLTTKPTEDTQFLMGTVCTIRIYNKDKQTALDDGFTTIKRLAKEITVNQKGSEIDRINAEAGKKPVKVSPEIFKLCQTAYYFSKNSDNSYDMAIGPITSLWRIGFPDAHKPTDSEIKARLPLVNYKNVVLNAKKHTVYLKEKGMALDLGGIAKGYITDQVKKTLQKDGVTSAIIDLGGNIYVLGESPTNHSNWTVGIQDPKGSRGTAIGSLPAMNKTIVTSGIYERYLKVGNTIYSHLMDPKTGYPFQNNLLGVSIITKYSTNGDALSTATFDKGLENGMRYIEGKKDTEAIFITKDKKVYISSGLKGKFKLFSDSGYKMASLK